MEKFQGRGIAARLERRSLLTAVNLVAGLSIFFFGYDQGVMGGVNTNTNYAITMDIGHASAPNSQFATITRSLKQGGIVAVYYLPGTLLGSFLGGWFGDRFGRIRTIQLGSVVCVVGATLQCSAQNANWMFCARVLNGIGTGILNAITPVWATETASHTSRGAFVASEFTLNIFGVVVAYWLEYGTSFYFDHDSSFIWRFPIAFQIFPLLVLVGIIWYMPESPRWLIKVGRNEEGRWLLGRLRGEEGPGGLAEAEFQDICNIVELENKTSSQNSYLAMFFGWNSGKLHTGRRVQLVVWLQILQEWIGIASITIYGPTIFATAGVNANDRLWLSGLNNITYMFSTLVCVFTIDRIGRRWTLYWGSVMQGISMFCAGGLARATLNRANAGENTKGVGGGAIFFIFLFTAVFGATWLTVPWLYPAEIFPLQVRARGNAWGVVGWSIGNGWTALVIPIMITNIGEKALYVFGAVNAATIVIVWALYPETNQRTLEEMNLVFAADSIWNWEAERNFAILKEQNPELVQAAQRGNSVIDPETGRRRSSAVNASLEAKPAQALQEHSEKK